MNLHTSMGSRAFAVMAALASTEREITRECITDSVAKRRAAGKDLGDAARPSPTPKSGPRCGRSMPGEPATQVARDLGMSRATRYRRMRELPSMAV